MKTFIGLDLETSGTDIFSGAVPIQLGIAVRPEGKALEAKGWYIGGWEWENLQPETYGPSHTQRAWWSSDSQKIHGLTPMGLKNMPTSFDVSRNAVEWLDNQGMPKPADLHIVGWNVAGFDLPFVRKYMPALDRRLSYRTVDLNAVTFALSGCQYFGRTMGYQGIKRASKEYALEEMSVLGIPEEWHDAQFDAIAALYCYDWLVRMTRSCT